jgi:hypothetical protein
MRTNEEREITAYFEDRVTAQRAMDDLEANGIDRDEMELSDKSSGGGFWDSMKRLFTGESYEQHATGCLLTVYADRESALPVLQRYGARFGEAGSICADDADADSAQPMKLREERMSVDKRAAKEGEVTLRKDVVTEQQTIEVPVSHEEVYVSRRPLCRRRTRDRCRRSERRGINYGARHARRSLRRQATRRNGRSVAQQTARARTPESIGDRAQRASVRRDYG